MNEDDEIVEAFLEESRENLAQLDQDLVALEARPDDPELLAPLAAARTSARPANPAVNRAGVEGPELIEPPSPEPEAQQSLL